MRLTTEQFLEDLHWCSLYDEVNNYKNNFKLTRYNEKCIYKLSQLEDIEDELGIDLITLFKALKNGIYHNQYAGISNIPWDFQIDIKNKRFYYHIQDMGASWDIYCYFKDYGKTWSLDKNDLTKEELEK